MERYSFEKNGQDIDTGTYKKDNTFRKAILIQRHTAIDLWRVSAANALSATAKTFGLGKFIYFSLTK